MVTDVSRKSILPIQDIGISFMLIHSQLGEFRLCKFLCMLACQYFLRVDQISLPLCWAWITTHITTPQIPLPFARRGLQPI